MRIRRWIVALSAGLMLVLAGSGAPAAFAATPITVTVNGVPVSAPVAPEIVNGTTLVPARAIAQALGASVTWDPTSNTVAIAGTSNSAGSMDVASVFAAVSPSIVGLVSIQHDGTGAIAAVDTGSGVVLDSSGLIVTNAHVLAGGDTFYVVTGPGAAQQIPSSQIWSDTVSDLAFLRTGITGLKPATLANSDNVVVGEPVIAIGNPLGYYLQDTVTRGVISGVGRDVTGASFYPLIQTDAAINPGNSGGALVDAAGQVIGITSLKFSSNNVQGLNFAIPSNVVQQMLQQFQQNGHVVRTWIGASLSEPWQVSVGLPTTDGLTVSSVVAGGPAALAGIQAGDEIMAVDGQAVHTNLALTSILWSHKPGETVTLSILRNGSTLSVQVALQQRPAGQ
ncbi:MAG TPA: trypsin-like peptidase domain-containing protein [Bacillota bacterium]|nr:trypsin-like peptidase domain-containing protein [Bacillota bacterium]